MTPAEQFSFALPEGLPHETGDYYSVRPGRTSQTFVTSAQTVQNDSDGPAMHWNFMEYGHGASPYVTPPNVRITLPLDLASFTQNTLVNYQAEVSDPVDGRLPAGAIIWTEDGFPIGNGTSTSHRETAVGTHTIRVTATNGDGKSRSAQITIRVQSATTDGAPTATITAPPDGQRYCVNNTDRAGNYYPVQLTATATDPAGLPLSYQWTDSADGAPAFLASTALSPTLRVYQTGNQQETAHDLTLTVSNGRTATSTQIRVYIMNAGFCIR